MSRRLGDESGFTLVEMMITLFLLGVLLAALSQAFASGLRASSDSSSRVSGQEMLRTSLDRLEFEARCASGATLGGSGASVELSLPTQCTHAAGTFTWCVTGGQLVRYAATTCTGTGDVFASNVTTPTPFSVITASGLLPRLQISLAVNTTGRASDAASVTDVIAMRNDARTS